jgi:hypothetical protein
MMGAVAPGGTVNYNLGIYNPDTTGPFGCLLMSGSVTETSIQLSARFY